MINLNIGAYPNQSFNKTIGNVEYGFRIHTLNGGIVVFSLTVDGETAIESERIIPNSVIIPYEYLKPKGGNFYFKSVSGDYPDYTKFGGEQNLLYLTDEEIEAARNG